MKYDVIIIGAGHSGCEAANAASKLGGNVLLITMNLDKIAWMSCNPAIGGLAKGHIVKELAVLGGLMPKIIDETGIQYRKLNKSKGMAVQSTRIQADKIMYSLKMREELFRNEKIDFFEGEVKNLILDKEKVIGVETEEGGTFFSKTTILSTGTFLGGKLFYGDKIVKGGRSGEKSSDSLSKFLRTTKHNIIRFKTGTPARVDSRTIDYSKIERQEHDDEISGFSLNSKKNKLKKLNCFVTRTTEKTYDIVFKNIKKAPMYSGIIEGKGPRYCPSIEDKVYKFPDKKTHQVFLEPEGINNIEIYVNGVSTGLPMDIQNSFYKTITGLENVKIIKPAYAVEYDCINPQELSLNLESKYIKNLFFAGQVNGTSGYEEAGAQGYLAGINAIRSINKKEPLIIDRSISYIGVLIDDIITKGVDEPYRVFTSRAENRLFLREDNADFRLLKLAKENNLLKDKEIIKIEKKWNKILNFLKKIENIKLNPSKEFNEKLKKNDLKEITKQITAKEFLRRESFFNLLKIFPNFKNYKKIASSIEIEAKYEAYIKMDDNKDKDLEKIKLKKTIYKNLKNLSLEARDKLDKVQPMNLAQASRIPGISPSDIDILLIYKKKGEI